MNRKPIPVSYTRSKRAEGFKMAQYKIDEYRIVPTKDGGMCLVGKVVGIERQTTDIERISPCGGQLATAGGSVYVLGSPALGMWPMQLQIKRPERYAALVKGGCKGLT